MRLLICPDSFTGTLTASMAADAMAEGWLSTSPLDDIQKIPMSDGGPGFVDAMLVALDGELCISDVRNLEGDSLAVAWARVGDTAYLESANVVGLHHVTSSTLWERSSFGVGQLISAAQAAGCRHIVIGLGGTGINDAGVGALAALGAIFTNASGNDVDVKEGPKSFAQVAKADLSDARMSLRNITLEIATDVDNPLLGLRGATHEYGPQKGATPRDVVALEAELQRMSQLIGRRDDGKDPAVALGAGAAGGLGYGLMSVGAQRSSGVQRIMNAVHISEAMDRADLILTGEGHFDWQSLRGKVVKGIATTAMETAKPVVVIAGQTSIGRRDWSDIGVSGAYSVSEAVGLEESIAHPYETLRETAARIARTWSR